MKSKKPRFGMIIGPYPHYVLVLSLVLGGMSLANNARFDWISWPLIGLGTILAVVPLILILAEKSRRIRVFNLPGEGLSFFEDRLIQLCECGGEIFSTYLAERADVTVDIVSQTLKSLHGDTESNSTIRYTRFVLLDDPTQEKRWVKDFFQAIDGTTGGVNMVPIVYAVDSPRRAWIRRIQAVLPRASITLISYKDKRKTKLVYVSLSPIRELNGDTHDPILSFAVQSPTIYDNTKTYIDRIIDPANSFIRRFGSLDEYDSVTEPHALPPLTERLINGIEEIAATNVHIKHVGVFGSVPRLLTGAVGNRSACDADSDVDIIVVISKNAEKARIKELIEKRLLSEVQDNGNSKIEIEWSLDRDNFYSFRNKYHVDIQLHHRGDNYYIQDTRLLGYAIFWSNYQVIYSERNLPIDSFLSIPQKPLSISKRAQLFLDDPLGLSAFIHECYKVNTTIDPRRVVAINTANLVWVMTGMRPHSIDSGLDYLESTVINEHHLMNANASPLGLDKLAKIRGMLRIETEEATREQPKHMSVVIDVLRDIQIITEAAILGDQK